MLVKWFKEKKLDEKVNKLLNLKFQHYLIIYALLFLLGIFYVFLKYVTVQEAYIYRNNIKEAITLPYLDTSNLVNRPMFDVNLYSKIPQKIKMTVVAPDIMDRIIFNGVEVDLNKEKAKYRQRVLDHNLTGYPFIFKLKRGVNNIKVYSTFTHEGNGLKLLQMFMVHDYILLFFCFVFVFLHLGARLFFMMLRKFNSPKKGQSLNINWAYIIILIGIMIRVLYVFSYGDGSYNHDHLLHIEYIKYFAENFEVPPPDKGTEYPQQPIYYIITGTIYALFNMFGLPESTILVILAWFSCVLNVVFLMFSYKLIRLLFDKELPRVWFTAFLSLTPTFVYTAGRINNDVLTMAFGIIALYYFAKYIKNRQDKNLLISICFIMLGFFTKVSFALWMLVIMFEFIRQYVVALKEASPDVKAKRKMLEKRILIFGVACLFVFGLTLQRVHLPGKNQFRFANSGKFPGQAINRMGTDYFFSFNFYDLIIEGQSYSYAKTDIIKQSFPTYQYGTFMFGEYDYTKIAGVFPVFKVLMSFIYMFGIVYIIGLIAFFFFFKRHELFYKLLTLAAGINFMLIFQLAATFPSACNTDFRYFSPTFAAIGIMTATGLFCLTEKFKHLKIPVVVLSVMYYTMQIIWLLWLILISVPNSVS